MLLSTHIPGWGCSTWGGGGSIRDTKLPQAQPGSEDAVKLMPSTSKINSPPPSHINELRQHWGPTPNPANYLQGPIPRQGGQAGHKTAARTQALAAGNRASLSPQSSPPQPPTNDHQHQVAVSAGICIIFANSQHQREPAGRGICYSTGQLSLCPQSPVLEVIHLSEHKIHHYLCLQTHSYFKEVHPGVTSQP